MLYVDGGEQPSGDGQLVSMKKVKVAWLERHAASSIPQARAKL